MLTYGLQPLRLYTRGGEVTSRSATPLISLYSYTQGGELTYGLPPLLYAVNNLLQERSITLVVGTR